MSSCWVASLRCSSRRHWRCCSTRRRELAFIESVYADEAYQNPEFVGALLFRGYGISRHHLFGLPLALGLSAALLMIVASMERPRLAPLARRGRVGHR